MVSKNTYYLDFTTTQFLAGKELLKSMPVFYNRVYFCKKYANALWSGEKEEHFSNIALIANEVDINSLRQIVKNNFLHIANWDSLKYTEKDDYGFSFIAGNIKFIIMPFKETETGYEIKSYETDSGACITTKLEVNKQFFLDSSVNENGEFVRTCDFNLEDINEQNSTKFIAERKVQPQMAVYDSSSGYALARIEYFVAFILISCIVIWIAYMIVHIA